MKFFYLETFGCQMNEYDSEKIHGILSNLEYIRTENPEKADLLILNTCLIRENAENKLFGRLGEFKNIKKKSPDKIIAVCGCIPQKEEIRDEILHKYPFIDLIFGTNTFIELPMLLQKLDNNDKYIVSIKNDRDTLKESDPTVRKYNHKGFINITYGCNNYCSYCIVPYTRGREVSRIIQIILNKIIKFSVNGIKEITLLGKNVNSFICPENSNVNFGRLLEIICSDTEIERIRFMSSHPKDIDENFIKIMKNQDKICKSIHLPVQSGSDKVLSEMNRKYTREKYLDIIRKLRSSISEISITTDIIVGFPGESERDFNDTLDIVKKAKFDGAFTFLYSPRKGTPAAERTDFVDKDTIQKRFNLLLETLYPYIYNSNKSYLGKTVEVLVDDVSKNDSSFLSGRTDTNKLVHFKGRKELIGHKVPVKIVSIKTWHLEGIYSEVL